MSAQADLRKLLVVKKTLPSQNDEDCSWGIALLRAFFCFFTNLCVNAILSRRSVNNFLSLKALLSLWCRSLSGYALQIHLGTYGLKLSCRGISRTTAGSRMHQNIISITTFLNTSSTSMWYFSLSFVRPNSKTIAFSLLNIVCTSIRKKKNLSWRVQYNKAGITY